MSKYQGISHFIAWYIHVYSLGIPTFLQHIHLLNVLSNITEKTCSTACIVAAEP